MARSQLALGAVLQGLLQRVGHSVHILPGGVAAQKADPQHLGAGSTNAGLLGPARPGRGQSRRLPPLRDPRPGYTRRVRASCSHTEPPRPRRSPQSLGRGPRAVASKGHSELSARWAQHDPGTAL